MLELLFTFMLFIKDPATQEVSVEGLVDLDYNTCMQFHNRVQDKYDPTYVYSICVPQIEKSY